MTDPSPTDSPLTALGLALAAESRAAARHRLFAQKADQAGRPDQARLFRAMAASERLHAERLLRLLQGKVGSAEENLKTAFEEELPAKLAAFDDLMGQLADDTVAAAVLGQTRRVEAAHQDLYAALAAGEAGESRYWVCGVCGHLAVGGPPERCPVCRAVPEKFGPVD